MPHDFSCKAQSPLRLLTFQTNNPTDPLPANEVASDFASHKASIDAAIEFQKLVQRSVGRLNNGSVRPEKMPLATPPPRDNRFGSPLKLSKVHWIRPEVVVEVTYLTWTEGGLLRAVLYEGQREDKPARQVVRSIPHIP